MHINTLTLYITIVWVSCSIINWFWLSGYYNDQFSKTLVEEKNFIWIILASVFSGISGFLVSCFAFKFKYWAWKPMSQKRKDQYLMIYKLETTDADADVMQGAMSFPLSQTTVTVPLAKKSYKKGKI